MIKYQFVALAAIYAGSFSYLHMRCKDHLPFHKYLSNHALLFAPLNFLFTFFTTGPRTAVLDTKSVPGLDELKANYPVIRAEAKSLLDAGVFRRPPATDEPGFNSFEKGGYRMYPLKWFTKKCRATAVQMCPKTCAIVDSIPAIRSALFTVLPPGAQLGRHHDPIASSLRYHLGLLTPNSAQCAMTLDGVEYPWFDGEELLFDQSYLHSIVNRTDTIRVILFCDVEKTLLREPIKSFANAVNYALVAKFTGADNRGKLSWFAWIYKQTYKVRSYVKENIKRRNIVAYNIIKFGFIGLLLYLLYLVI